MYSFIQKRKKILFAALLIFLVVIKLCMVTALAEVSDMVTASVSTVEWREKSLEKVVQTILPQVNRLNVFLQGYKSVPVFLNDPKITVAVGELYPSILARGDAAKFFWANSVQGYHFIIDDDILYPSNYVAYCIEKIEQYHRKAVVGLHGCILKKKMYSLKDRILLSFEKRQKQDIPVHILGTGVIAYHTDTIKIKMADFLKKNTSDVWFGIIAQKQKIPLICIQRPKLYLKSLPESHSPYAICRQKNGCKKRFNAIQKHKSWKLYVV